MPTPTEQCSVSSRPTVGGRVCIYIWRRSRENCHENGETRRMASLAVKGFGSLWLSLLIFAPAQAAAGEIVAIVEEAPAGSGLVAMDYVEAGHAIQLAQGELLIVGYFSSCLREVIDGGKIRIGTERSEVVGGTVTRTKLDCIAGGLQLSQEQAQQSGVLISRSIGPPKINTLQPVFALSSDGILKIVRQDQPSSAVEISVSDRRAVDLAIENILLEAGGIYRAEIGEKNLRFSVSKTAVPANGKLLSRLLAF